MKHTETVFEAMFEETRRGDVIAQYVVAEGAARMLVADTTALAEAARLTHGLLPTACAALGRALTGAALLAVDLKNPRASMTVGLYGDGPLGSVVCVGDARGGVKGYVDHPDTHLPLRADGKLDVGGAVGRGRLAVVRDEGEGEPYVGQVAIRTGEIADDIAWYLAASVGQPSLLALGVTVDSDGVAASAGILIQPMPGCPDEVLRALEQCAPLLTSVSSALADLGGVDALARYAVTGLPVYRVGSSVPRFACGCSRERISGVLLSMGEAELTDMIARQGSAEIVCHFCRTAYHFGCDELAELLRQAKDGAGEVAP